MDRHKTDDHYVNTQNYSTTLKQQAKEADTKMRKIFGLSPYILEKIPHDGYTQEEFEALVDQVEKEDENSPLLPFLHAGVIPIHPEFNFIPTEDQSASKNPTKGKFIELKILNIDALRNAAKAKAKNETEKKSIERFADQQRLYTILEDIYAWTKNPNRQRELYPGAEADIFKFTNAICKKISPLIKNGEFQLYQHELTRRAFSHLSIYSDGPLEQQIKKFMSIRWRDIEKKQTDQKIMLHTLFQETLQQIEIDIGIFNERKKYLKDI